MRGTGGLPGAFAILVANKGVVQFTHFESDAALTGRTIPTSSREIIEVKLREIDEDEQVLLVELAD